MRIGKPIDRSHDASVVPPSIPMPRKKQLKYAFMGAVPLAVAVGVALKTKKSKRPAARRPQQHFRPSSVSEPAANQPSTSRFEELQTSTTTDWGLLKQPDNQK